MNVSSEKLLNLLREIKGEGQKMASAVGPGAAEGGPKQGGPSFADHLKEHVQEVNGMQATSDRMAMELATGKTGNIHETMLAATQAELAFNLMVQVRNKALEAYGEIMRMPV